jgi:hypothetical protein
MLVQWINLDEFFIGDEWTASVDNAFRRDALCGEQLVNGGANHSLLQRLLHNPSHDKNRGYVIWSVYGEWGGGLFSSSRRDKVLASETRDKVLRYRTCKGLQREDR